MLTLEELTRRVAGPGRVEWIGVRPERHAPVLSLDAVDIGLTGLAGDHRKRPGQRAVSLIQAEHLPVIASLARRPDIGFAILRRNIAVSGLNLSALRGRQIALGGAILRLTGPCAPCSRMETALGPGGYTAMRGHGGMVAEVLKPGRLAVGDKAVPCEPGEAYDMR